MFLYVSKLGLYDKIVIKEDRLNYVAKCKFLGIEKVKKAKQGLGENGKLTKPDVKMLTTY